jgi:hypothetical protein
LHHIFSCKKKIDFNLSKDCYKSSVKLVGQQNDTSELSFPEGNIKIEFSTVNYYCRYSNEKSRNIFQSNDIEIEFQLLEYDERYKISPPRFLCKYVFIGIKFIDNEYKSYIIIWKNDPNINSGISEKEFDISNKADSIFTNLDFVEIKKLFPEFEGAYKLLNCDTVTINVGFAINTNEFYHRIKFDNEMLVIPHFFPDYRKPSHHIIL